MSEHIYAVQEKTYHTIIGIMSSCPVLLENEIFVNHDAWTITALPYTLTDCWQSLVARLPGCGTA